MSRGKVGVLCLLALLGGFAAGYVAALAEQGALPDWGAERNSSRRLNETEALLVSRLARDPNATVEVDARETRHESVAGACMGWVERPRLAGLYVRFDAITLTFSDNSDQVSYLLRPDARIVRGTAPENVTVWTNVTYVAWNETTRYGTTTRHHEPVWGEGSVWGERLASFVTLSGTGHVPEC